MIEIKDLPTLKAAAIIAFNIDFQNMLKFLKNSKACLCFRLECLINVKMAEGSFNGIKKNNNKKMTNMTSSSTVLILSENKEITYNYNGSNKPSMKRSKSINTFKSSKEVSDKINLKKLDRNISMLNSIENVYDCPKRRDKLLGMLKLNQKTSRFIKTKKNPENSLQSNFLKYNGKLIYF